MGFETVKRAGKRAALAVLAVAVAAAAQAQDARGVTKDKVTIGSWMSLSGPVAVYGTPLKTGAEAFFKAQNAKGGINGRQIDFIVEDNAYNPQQTIAAARKLVTRDKVLALLMPHGTGQTAATFPYVLDKEKLPVLLPYGQALDWYKPTPKRGVLALHVLYESQVEAIARLAAQDGHKSITVIHSAHAAFEAVSKYAQPAASKINADVKVELVAVKMGTSDYAPVARDLIAKKPDAVIAIITIQELALLAKALRQQSSDLPIYTYGPNVSQSTIELGGAHVEGVTSVSLTLPPDSDTPEIAQFRADMATYAPGQPLDFVALLGYGGAKVFAAGLAAAPEPLTRDSLLEGFYSLKAYDSGIFPPVSYAPDAPIGASVLFPLKIEGGKWVAAGDPINTAAFDS